MPRPERPLEQDGSVTCEFAQALRQLRREAGSPPYRLLAARAHYSASTLAAAAGGRQLPSLQVTRAFAAACGADPGVWEQRWRDTRALLDTAAATTTAGASERVPTMRPPGTPAGDTRPPTGVPRYVPPESPRLSLRSIRVALAVAVAASLAGVVVLYASVFGAVLPSPGDAPRPAAGAERISGPVRPGPAASGNGDLRVSSADGRLMVLATSDDIQLWDTHDVAVPPRCAARITPGFPPAALRLDGGGAILTAVPPYRAGQRFGQHERRWDVTDPAHPRELHSTLPAV
ncbi:helix-turn-helix domain-containing protein [Amycolatopsis sp. NPDC059021]|uniref:helix-turn-helix domain-containing protein n=1 Tax=Amycolatopsis sp. NPDC059021 TaxID=3346704 RepID=UPI00367286B3